MKLIKIHVNDCITVMRVLEKCAKDPKILMQNITSYLFSYFVHLMNMTWRFVTSSVCSSQVCVRTSPPPLLPPLITAAAPASPSSSARAAIRTWTRKRRMRMKTTVSCRHRSRVWVAPEPCSAACRIHTPSAASGTGGAAARHPAARRRRRHLRRRLPARHTASGAAQVIIMINCICVSWGQKWCVLNGDDIHYCTKVCIFVKKIKLRHL